MRRPIGRPMKYHDIILKLDPDDLYTPATIAYFAHEHEFIAPDLDEDALRLAKHRIRMSLGRFSNNHDFPDEGDGMVTLNGQAPTPAWFGWRWQEPVS